MAVLIPTTEGDIEGGRFLALAIDSGTWSVMADVIGFDDPIVVEDFASEAAAQAGLQAVVDALAAEGDVFQDAVFQDVTVLGTLRTALSGQRIEIGTEEISRLDFYTGHEDEDAPATLTVDVIEDVQGKVILRPPHLDGDDPNTRIALSGTSAAVGQTLVEVIADLIGFIAGASGVRISAVGGEVVVGEAPLVIEDSYLEVQDPTDGFIQLPVLASAPASPPSGHIRVYAIVDGGQAKLAYKRSTGTQIVVS